MSSRLFQKIREEMGMAYSVFTYPALYASSGMYGVYAGTMADNTLQVAEMILKELKTVKRERDHGGGIYPKPGTIQGQPDSFFGKHVFQNERDREIDDPHRQCLFG